MFKNIPPFTKKLILLNVLFFVIKLLLESKSINLDVILGTFYPLSPNFHSYQIISHLFMHGNFTHLLFNMIALWSFGSSVEYRLGGKKFFFLYFICGLGAFTIYSVWTWYGLQDIVTVLESHGVDVASISNYAKLNIHGDYALNINDLDKIVPQKANVQLVSKYIQNLSTPMVGASGAIYGLLAAFALLFPNQKIMMIFPPIPIAAKIMMPILMLIEFYLGVQNSAGDNVAHFAHIGGAIFAFIVLKIWKV